jgi:hypothetical protein
MPDKEFTALASLEISLELNPIGSTWTINNHVDVYKAGFYWKAKENWK